MEQIGVANTLRSTATGTGRESVITGGSGKKVAITTLGCKINSYESELICQALRTDNWQVVRDTEVADLYLINTCTVTREADRQARQQVRRAVRRNQDALVVVTGCYAQMDPDACAAIAGVDLVLGNDRKLDVHKLLPKLQRGELAKVMVGDLDQHVGLAQDLLAGYQDQTRAFVQVQQGCDQGCTFCIIHVARGPSRSLPLTLIKRQVQRLVMNDYPEIVICGVDLGSYGADLRVSGDDFKNLELSSSLDLTDLLKELLDLEYQADNPFRIRLSSIDPAHLENRLIELIAAEPRICPHIHLSLQSGNTLILKRMKRRYDADFVLERISSLRAKVPGLVLSCDVMVGFPTETEEQFQDTAHMLKKLNIVYPHVFSYSERDGTPAARIPNNKQVAVPTRKSRNKKLREIGSQLHAKLLAERVGSYAWVLPENTKRGSTQVLCRAEDYLTVMMRCQDVVQGRWCYIQYTGVKDGHLLGKL